MVTMNKARNIYDQFGSILSKNDVVAYVEDGKIARGRVVEAIRIGMPESEIVRIEPFAKPNDGLLIVRPACEVMSIILPAT